MSDPPFVSVIVPVLNGERTLADCLSSLLSADYPESRREIIVVDNGSRDGTAEIACALPVTYVREDRRGAARARNRGIDASRGELVAFTDVDCLATTGWLRELVRPFEDDRVGGVAGEVLPYPPRTAAERYAAQLRHLSPRRYLNRPILPFAVTANLAFRREVFEQVGLFDPDSPRGGESTDFCTRFFRATGLRLEFAPGAAVFHRHRATAWELFRQQWSYGRGHAFLYIKYADDVPWGWRETTRVWGDLAASAGQVVRTGARRVVDRASADDLSFEYLALVRKLALRLGFATEALSRRRLLL